MSDNRKYPSDRAKLAKVERALDRQVATSTPDSPIARIARSASMLDAACKFVEWTDRAIGVLARVPLSDLWNPLGWETDTRAMSGPEAAYEDDGNTRATGTKIRIMRAYRTIPGIDPNAPWWAGFGAPGLLVFSADVTVRNRDDRQERSGSEVHIHGWGRAYEGTDYARTDSGGSVRINYSTGGIFELTVDDYAHVVEELEAIGRGAALRAKVRAAILAEKGK